MILLQYIVKAVFLLVVLLVHGVSSVFLNFTDIDFVATNGCSMYSHYCIRPRQYTLDQIYLFTEGLAADFEAIVEGLQRDGADSGLAEQVAESISLHPRRSLSARTKSELKFVLRMRRRVPSLKFTRLVLCSKTSSTLTI